MSNAVVKSLKLITLLASVSLMIVISIGLYLVLFDDKEPNQEPQIDTILQEPLKKAAPEIAKTSKPDKQIPPEKISEKKGLTGFALSKPNDFLQGVDFGDKGKIQGGWVITPDGATMLITTSKDPSAEVVAVLEKFCQLNWDACTGYFGEEFQIAGLMAVIQAFDDLHEKHGLEETNIEDDRRRNNVISHIRSKASDNVVIGQSHEPYEDFFIIASAGFLPKSGLGTVTVRIQYHLD